MVRVGRDRLAIGKRVDSLSLVASGSESCRARSLRLRNHTRLQFLGVGPSASGSCTIANSTSATTIGANPQLSVTENAGNYCVRVTDAGTLTTTAAVRVTVTPTIRRQAGGDTRRGHAEHVVDVLETRVRRQRFRADRSMYAPPMRSHLPRLQRRVPTLFPFVVRNRYND